MILVIAEAALELVPENISNHPSVINHARRRRKNPSKIILEHLIITILVIIITYYVGNWVAIVFG